VLAKSHDMLDSFVLISLFCFRGRAPRTLDSRALAGPALFPFLPHASISLDSPPIDLMLNGTVTAAQEVH